MFPVDGTVMLYQDGMFEVLKLLKAPVMIPMHAFSSFTLIVSSTARATGRSTPRHPDGVVKRAAAHR